MTYYRPAFGLWPYRWGVTLRIRGWLIKVRVQKSPPSMLFSERLNPRLRRWNIGPLWVSVDNQGGEP